jgi:hypothetical protein
MKKLSKLLLLASALSILLFSIPAFADTTIHEASMPRLNFNSNGAQTVFTGDQTGYLFFCNIYSLYYSKTTDAGSNWANAVKIDDADINDDCYSNAVWYDQWTPGDSGTKVHILAGDSSTDDDLIYIEFDTSDDSSTVAGNISDAAGMAAGNYEDYANNLAITKATDGDLYAAIADDTSDYVLTCTGTCTTSGNWAETSGASPFEAADDHIQLMPLSDGDIMMIQHDLSADVVEAKIWNETSWGSFSTIESSVEDLSETLVEFGSPPLTATINPDDHTIYLAYIDYDTGGDFGSGDDDDIKTAKYSGGSWSTTTDALTDNSGVAPYGLSIAYDESNDEVYLSYSGPDNTVSGTHDDGSTNYYYKSSSNEMSNWGSQSAAIATSDFTDFRTRLVGMNFFSDERLYLIWFNDSGPTSYLYGDTIVDLIPPAAPAAPEFRDYLYFTTLVICLYLVFNRRSPVSSTLKP